MGIPTEVDGSLPRPDALQEAYAAYDGGEISKDEFVKAQDQARAGHFATYPITDTLGGTGLAPGLAPDGQCFPIFDDDHHRQLSRLTSGPFKYQTYASGNFKKSQPFAKGRPMKTAVIAPSMLYLLYPPKNDIPGYPKSRFLPALVDECEKNIRGCFEAGAQRVSIDFTEGRLTAKRDRRNPWTNEDLLQTFVDLNNRVLNRFTPRERTNIGLHTCPEGDCDSARSPEVPYHPLLPSLFQINAGYILIQLASEEDKINVYDKIGENIRRDANGVKQVAFIDVTKPQDPRVETPDEIADALVEAVKHIPKDMLGATDDCGFSPFSIDRKPKHGSGGPDFARVLLSRRLPRELRERKGQVKG